MQPIQFIIELPASLRILSIILLAIIAHFIVRELRRLSQWMLTPAPQTGISMTESFARRYPRLATLITVFVSAITFTIYFVAVGLILKEFNVSLKAYLASASVIGLAIGFGSQGLVQDVVIGLTLIFSDALNIEDLVEISGQIGKVEEIGLRFTTLVNLHGQKIYIPNRNIGIIGRFRRGYIRAYVDVQIPDQFDDKEISEDLRAISKGMYDQHKSIILAEPEIFKVKEAKAGKWRYLRVKFHLWPGQSSLIETTFKQRVIALLKKLYPDYPDWMITVTYKAE